MQCKCAVPVYSVCTCICMWKADVQDVLHSSVTLDLCFLRQGLSLNINLIDLGLSFLTNAPRGSTSPYPSWFWTQKSKVTGRTCHMSFFLWVLRIRIPVLAYMHQAFYQLSLVTAIICFLCLMSCSMHGKGCLEIINWQWFLVPS